MSWQYMGMMQEPSSSWHFLIPQSCVLNKLIILSFSISEFYRKKNEHRYFAQFAGNCYAFFCQTSTTLFSLIILKCGYTLFSYAVSPSRVCQPLDRIIICRVKSARQTTHPALSKGISWQCETSSGSRPQEHRSYESVRHMPYFATGATMAQLCSTDMILCVAEQTDYCGQPNGPGDTQSEAFYNQRFCYCSFCIDIMAAQGTISQITFECSTKSLHLIATSRHTSFRFPKVTDIYGWNMSELVFPFPDVLFYSQEYGNGSSHSRAPGNDVYYEGLMTEKIYYQRAVRKCYY